MTDTHRLKICEAAVSHFGVAHQVGKAIEELGELVVELARWAQEETREPTPELMFEMADVWVMMNQLALIFGDTEERQDCKLLRLEETLRKAGVTVEEDDT